MYPESETSLDFTGEDGKLGVLTGFVTAVGPAGIHALRATMLDERSTPWVGMPERAPKSLRLCMGQRITHINALFDVTSPYPLPFNESPKANLFPTQGFKMVSLAVPESRTPDSATEARSCDRLQTSPYPTFMWLERALSRSQDMDPPLRESALWEPDIPPKGLCLYDNRFPWRVLQLRQYRPLIHVIFGGPKGAYLRYLTNIFVVNSGDLIGTIGFEYNAPGAPVARMEAGQIIRRGDSHKYTG
jgi:U3 small nucleolar RNA-associated protein 4